MKTCIADKRHDLQGQRSKSRGHVVRLTAVGPLGLLENEKFQKWMNENENENV